MFVFLFMMVFSFIDILVFLGRRGIEWWSNRRIWCFKWYRIFCEGTILVCMSVKVDNIKKGRVVMHGIVYHVSHVLALCTIPYTAWVAAYGLLFPGTLLPQVPHGYLGIFGGPGFYCTSFASINKFIKMSVVLVSFNLVCYFVCYIFQTK